MDKAAQGQLFFCELAWLPSMDGLKARANAIGTSLIESINSRFKNLDVLDAFICFEPSHYVGCPEGELDDLFAHEFGILKSHFCGTGFFEEGDEARNR
jgi:hypothetical protein